jgi:hypothetical protein
MGDSVVYTHIHTVSQAVTVYGTVGSPKTVIIDVKQQWIDTVKLVDKVE